MLATYESTTISNIERRELRFLFLAQAGLKLFLLQYSGILLHSILTHKIYTTESKHLIIWGFLLLFVSLTTKSTSDCLELELWQVVSHPMWVLEPNSSCLKEQQQVLLTAKSYFQQGGGWWWFHGYFSKGVKTKTWNIRAQRLYLWIKTVTELRHSLMLNKHSTTEHLILTVHAYIFVSMWEHVPLQDHDCDPRLVSDVFLHHSPHFTDEEGSVTDEQSSSLMAICLVFITLGSCLSPERWDYRKVAVLSPTFMWA